MHGHFLGIRLKRVKLTVCLLMWLFALSISFEFLFYQFGRIMQLFFYKSVDFVLFLR